MEFETVNAHYRREFLRAVQVFDLVDDFARQQGVRGAQPRPFGRITFWGLGQMLAGEMRNFPAPCRLLTQQNPSGFTLFFGAVEEEKQMRRHLSPTGGTYRVRIESQYYQPVQADLVWPMPDPRVAAAFALLPGFAYPFPQNYMPGEQGPTLLRGNVVDDAAKGLADITIEVVGLDNVSYRTDRRGQFALLFPVDQPTGDVTVRFTLPDGQVRDVGNVSITQGATESLKPQVFPR